MIRVVFCWAETSSYMAACWRALSARPGIDLHVLHLDSLTGAPTPLAASPVMDGLSHERFSKDREDVDAFLMQAITARRPDVVVLCGWIYWPYTRVVRAPELQGARLILGMDSPWRGTALQRLARLRLGHIAPRLDMVVTATERTAEYARRIGIDDERLRSGYYGCDYRSFAGVADARDQRWPRAFLFTGRYVAEKDVGTLMAAYRQYRDSVADPWSLTCCGAGPDAALIAGDGVSDLGFVQPGALPDLFRRHGAFVLPSRFEPWGVVIAEAAAAGLPIVCTSACGAALDVVRSYYNGLIVAPGDVAGLARALGWMHDHESTLRDMGRRGQPLAAAFSAEAWAERWHNYMLEALDVAPRA